MTSNEPSMICSLCKKGPESGVVFKKSYICTKCMGDLYELYWERHYVVRETSKLSKKIDEALTKVIKKLEV